MLPGGRRGALMHMRGRRRPLISSVNALRALAAGITMVSLLGMTAYAGEHLHNTTAPLQPAAATSAVTAPASTTAPTTGRLQLTRGITTTTTRPVTTTHRS
jgi:hypothetical protein